MRKMRYVKSFIDEELKEFKWIKSVRSIKNFIPTATKTYSIEFTDLLEKLGKIENGERKRLEKFIKSFFEVCNGHGKNSIIFCWRETGLIFIVFPVFN